MNFSNCKHFILNIKKQENIAKILVFGIFVVFFLISCSPQEKIAPIAKKGKIQLPSEIYHKKIHEYGGWSCPDNVIGFPAIDVQEYKNIPIVNGRLPTKEETQNGTSLMYFDLKKYPTAKPLDMQMPRMARYYSKYTNKNELVIVIQAIAVDQDTVAGFRYLNGGNGSAWIEDVDFITDEEVEEIGNTPFVSLDIKTKANNEQIWEVITSPKYAKTLGQMFDKDSYVESDWQLNSEVNFKNGKDEILSTGIVTASWQDLYLQVDYDFAGYHYAEKFLILKNQETEEFTLHLVAGPYSEGYEEQKVVWANWLNKVKDLSEGITSIEKQLGIEEN